MIVDTKKPDLKEKLTKMLKPCVMVALHTRVSGGVSYQRKALDAEPPCAVCGAPESDGRHEPGARVALSADEQRLGGFHKYEPISAAPDQPLAVTRWETTKTVQDPEEHAAAEKLRSKARGMIAKMCTKTPFSLICALEREPELDAAIAEARAEVRAFNVGAETVGVALMVVKGRIATSDQEAAKAIGAEVADMVEAMSGAIAKLDVDGIREAASRASELVAVLSDEQQVIVNEAVKQARSAARTIAKRVELGGEEAAIVLADIKRGALEKARIAFLDLSDDAAPEGAMPTANVGRAAALEMNEDDEVQTPADMVASSIPSIGTGGM